MVDIDELERLRGALENIGNLSLDGCIKVNTPHGLWVGTPDAYAREVLGMPWRAPEGHQRMTDTEIRELRAENARLKKLTNPTWFYHPDYPEYCKFDPSEVIDEDYDPLPGVHVFEIHCAAALPSIWCAVYVSNDPDADERFTYTEHASEAEARAALGEPQ